MGARKRLRANQNKEAKKEKAFAILRDCPTSPQKMRLVADLIRGVDVQKALGKRVDEASLFVQEIFVDGAGMLKRLRPAPQGRAHRIRKRSNHVTIVLGSKTAVENITKE